MRMPDRDDGRYRQILYQKPHAVLAELNLPIPLPPCSPDQHPGCQTLIPGLGKGCH